MAAHTPGPWAWFGGESAFYLATTHSGRRYVMAFKRRGLNSAQPVFQVANRMVPADKLCEFEVGDASVRGFDEARKSTSVYRYDVSGIDAPDARLIAASPMLFDAARKALNFIENTESEMGEKLPSGDALRAALALAEGEA